MQNKLTKLYETTGGFIERGEFKSALKSIFEFVRWTNKYFDEQKPWVTFKDDPDTCYHTLYQCLYSILNLANLLEPFFPFSSKVVKDMLDVKESYWQPLDLVETCISDIQILFKRLNLLDLFVKTC